MLIQIARGVQLTQDVKLFLTLIYNFGYLNEAISNPVKGYTFIAHKGAYY